MKPTKTAEMGNRARQFVIDNYSVEVIGPRLEKIIHDMPEVDFDFDFAVPPKNPEYNPKDIKDTSEWLVDIYKNILNMDVDENEDGHKHWTKRMSEGMSRSDVLSYFKKVASEDNAKSKKTDFKDILGDDDEGKRLLISMPQSIGDVYLCTSLLKNIKETYPDYNIYCVF